MFSFNKNIILIPVEFEYYVLSQNSKQSNKDFITYIQDV